MTSRNISSNGSKISEARAAAMAAAGRDGLLATIKRAQHATRQEAGHVL